MTRARSPRASIPGAVPTDELLKTKALLAMAEEAISKLVSENALLREELRTLRHGAGGEAVGSGRPNI